MALSSVFGGTGLPGFIRRALVEGTAEEVGVAETQYPLLDGPDTSPEKTLLHR